MHHAVLTNFASRSGSINETASRAFLVIQLISVTRFIMWLNDWCRSETIQKRW